MKKMPILLVAALLLLVGGCSKSEIDDGGKNSEYLITISPSFDNTSTTNRSCDLGLYAYSTAKVKWSDYSTSLTMPNLMDNQKVEKSDGGWSYSPAAYWPKDSERMISFFAYMPCGVACEPAVESGVLPSITFTMGDDAADMVDFMVAAKLDEKQSESSVDLPFFHALTSLNVAAKRSNKVPSTSQISVTDIKVVGSSRLFKKATYSLSIDGKGGAWDTTKSLVFDGDMDLEAIMPTEPSPITATPQSLFSEGDYLFLIPPYGKTGVESADDITIQIDYQIVSLDATTTHSATISMPNETLKEGVAYDLVITIGLDGVVGAVDTTSWYSDQIEDASPEESMVTSASDIIAAWESHNTDKETDNKTQYTIDVINNIESSFDLSSADALYNFEQGDKVVLNYIDAVTYPTTITLPEGWSYNASIRTITKISPKGWYISDLTGMDEVTSIILLDSELTSDEWQTLRVAFGSDFTRSTVISKDGVTLTMPYLKKVEKDGFRGTVHIKSLTLPQVSELGDNSLAGMENLQSLTLATDKNTTLTKIGENLFGEGDEATPTENVILSIGNHAGASATQNTWILGGTSHKFKDVETPNAPVGGDGGDDDDDDDTSVNVGGQEMGDGGDIVID